MKPELEKKMKMRSLNELFRGRGKYIKEEFELSPNLK